LPVLYIGRTVPKGAAAESAIKHFLLFMLCHVIFMCLCNLCLRFGLVLSAHYALKVAR